MAIELACSAYVEHRKAVPTCRWRRLQPDVARYLEGHVADLARKALTNISPPASFASSRGRDAFERLASGTDREFLAAAQQLAASLQSKMDGRTKRGVLVALRRDGDPRVAVLKLDVVREHAGALGSNGNINAVAQLLDITGALQKGAIIPDERPNSSVVVGDKLGDSAQYFLDALGISQLQKPGAAVADLARVLYAKLPQDKAESAIERLPGTPASTITEFLDLVRDVVDDDARTAVLDQLGAQLRPAQFLDASRVTVKKTIRGDGITIAGAVGDMERVKLERLKGTDKWRLEIVFESEPEIRF